MQKKSWALLGLGLGLLGGCVGTRTGNPSTGNPSQPIGEVPFGAELARSELTRAEDPTLSDEDRTAFGSDNRAFALSAYQTLSTEPGNLFFSPYSISTALAMTYAGAKGETAAEMASTLHYGLGQPNVHVAFNATDYALLERKHQLSDEPSAGDGFELNVVNQAWGRKGYQFLDSYLDVLARNYGAGLFLLDFEPPEPARMLINDWVEKQTRSRVKDLLPQGSLSGSTALVLTNAIYFKASWLTHFEPGATQMAPFHAGSGDRDVPTMHAKLTARYAQRDGYEMVELPYLSRNVVMLLVLPPAGKPTQLDAERFDALRAELSGYLVTLSLPKWSFESERMLKAPLRTLGMRRAFESGAADFSGMDGMPSRLFIDEVYHKAFVAVDEQGTEAAAATAVVLREKSEPEQVEVAFDRPFVFAVYDEPTGQILFLGQLAEP